MNLLLSDVLWVALFVVLAVLWWRGQGVKALALKKVRLYCEDNNLQLLDDSLVLSRLWLSRGPNGFLQLRRTYRFEFTSTGEYRYRGTILLLAEKVLSVQVQTHHLQ